MAEQPNVFADTFTIERGSVRGEPVARNAGAELLGGTLYELSPGADGAPLHIHHAMEELLVVLEGSRPCARSMASGSWRPERWWPFREDGGGLTRWPIAARRGRGT